MPGNPNGGHCSSVRVRVFLDGQLVNTTPFLGWTYPGYEGPNKNLPLTAQLLPANLVVSAGTHTLDLQAEGTPGGCNAGALASWGGTFSMTALQCPAQPLPQCSDGIDNDGDGLVDFPADPGCFGPTDNDEFNQLSIPQCPNGQQPTQQTTIVAPKFFGITNCNGGNYTQQLCPEKFSQQFTLQNASTVIAPFVVSMTARGLDCPDAGDAITVSPSNRATHDVRIAFLLSYDAFKSLPV